MLRPSADLLPHACTIIRTNTVTKKSKHIWISGFLSRYITEQCLCFWNRKVHYEKNNIYIAGILLIIQICPDFRPEIFRIRHWLCHNIYDIHVHCIILYSFTLGNEKMYMIGFFCGEAQAIIGRRLDIATMVVLCLDKHNCYAFRILCNHIQKHCSGDKTKVQCLPKKAE